MKRSETLQFFFFVRIKNVRDPHLSQAWEEVEELRQRLRTQVWDALWWLR